MQAVRSSSGVGLSVIYVEFDWGTDIYVDRQIVAEKLALAADRLPEGVKPQLAPISSIMGQILHGRHVQRRRQDRPDRSPHAGRLGRAAAAADDPGVAQVITMGGGRKQFQVLVNPDALLKYDVTLDDVEQAVASSNANATGGYLDEGGNELLVRSLGRIQRRRRAGKGRRQSAEPSGPSCSSQVARVREAAQVKRGDAAVNGSPAVMLTISKQPGADTRLLTDERHRGAGGAASRRCRPTSASTPTSTSRRSSSTCSIDNVIEALRDGGILVVIILFLFLLNFRTTFITLTAIPLSIVVTGLVFKWFGMSINTMTLGGLAVAIGELVDDAIVDVENIFRRLRENRHAAASQVGPARRLRGQQRGPQFDRVQHDPGGAGVRAAVRPGRHGRPAVHAAGRGLHRLDPGVAGRVAHRHAGAVVLAAAAMPSSWSTSRTACCCGS